METCWCLPPSDRIPAAAGTCRQRRLNGAEVYRDARHARHGVDCLTVAVETDEFVGDAAVDAIIPVFGLTAETMRPPTDAPRPAFAGVGVHHAAAASRPPRGAPAPTHAPAFMLGEVDDRQSLGMT